MKEWLGAHLAQVFGLPVPPFQKRSWIIGVLIAMEAWVLPNLRVINPNKKTIDTRTPDDLLDIIDAKGKGLSEA